MTAPALPARPPARRDDGGGGGEWRDRPYAPGAGVCGGCGMAYGGPTWPGDVLVPDAVWAEISPCPDIPGAGLLCPNCICHRISDGGRSGLLLPIDVPMALNGEPAGGFGWQPRLRCRVPWLTIGWTMAEADAS